MMYPYTAMKLKESKKNTLKDFIAAAGIYQVSHLVLMSATEKSNYLRFVKNPRGPTLTFKVENYSLSKDVIKFY